MDYLLWERLTMTSRFRPDIEGLRALAILPILAFHLDPSLCPGGFVGVDIFFVISGFLITGMILDQGESFSFKSFYLRRLLRLFPALFTTLLATMMFAWRTMGPAEFEQLAKTAIAAAAGVSNFFFFATHDYFQPAGTTQPLLHTWSLGLEEQVYLFWPALIVWAVRRGRLAASIAAVAIISFLFVYAVRPMQPQAVFYLMPFRLFEFAAGAGLALLRPRFAALPPLLRLVGGAFAMLAIAGALVGFDGATPWPGAAALVPTFATATLIAVGGRGFWHSVLTVMPLRWIGRISYSLYLVHWPVIVVYRNSAIPDGGWLECMRLGGAAIGLGLLLYVLVEDPFRDGAGKYIPRWFRWLEFGRTMRLAGSAALGAGVLLFAGAALATSGFPHRIDRGRVQMIDKGLTYAGDLCDSRIARCTFGAKDSDRIVYVVGDSHALNLIYGLDGFFREHNIRGVAFYDHGCLFAYGTKRFISGVTDDVCRRNVQRSYDHLRGNGHPVIIAGNYAGYRNEMGPSEASAPLRLDEAQYYAWLHERHVATLELLNASKRPVVIVKQTYDAGIDPPRCLSQPGVNIQNQHVRCPANSLPRVKEIYARADALIDAVVEAFPSAVAIDPKSHFCEPSPCAIAAPDGRPYLRDSSHLTNEGSVFLVGRMRDALSRVLLP
jgi:peptidoglycan/LPS O-acetylase OafA/YrhL